MATNADNNINDDDVKQQDRWRRHLDWSAQQGRILTADGRAAAYYTTDRGFDFQDVELPHYYLLQERQAAHATTSGGTTRKDVNATDDEQELTDTRTIFRTWRQERDTVETIPTAATVLVGAWKRTLFYGGWEHTTDANEHVYNLQTPSLFIDLRLPTTRLRTADRPTITSLEDLEAVDLRRLARQHVFGGYTVMEEVSSTSNNNNTSPYPLVCTRHHIMDWNFVGRPRNRPNKWYVQTNDTGTKWKEWAYATDEYGQKYYCEHWERLTDTVAAAQTSRAVVALRQVKSVDTANSTSDGLLLVVGNHFNYLLDDRTPRVAAMELDETNEASSLVDTVDACLKENNLEAARAWLSLRGGHGLVSPTVGWTIDAATEFWKEGQCLFTTRDDIQVVVDDSEEANEGDAWWKEHAFVRWKGVRWEIFECNLPSAQDLQHLFWKGL